MANKTYIVIHHSTTTDGVTAKDFDTLKKNHLALGWRDIGYHWVIEKVNGILTAIPGRAEWDDGAHCPGRNVDGIGVCCIGNFENDTPSDEIYRVAAKLCKEIMARHPIKEIGAHRDYYATACPGKNFDMSKLKKYIAGEKEEMERYETMDDIPDWGKSVVMTLMAKGALYGDENGKLNLSEDMLRTLVIIDRMGVFPKY